MLMRPPIAAAWLAAALALPGACTAIPELDGAVPPALSRAGYPRLVPVEPLLAQADETRITPRTEAGIAARVAALRARAARLRHAVIDPGTRARMRAGVTRPDG